METEKQDDGDWTPLYDAPVPELIEALREKELRTKRTRELEAQLAASNAAIRFALEFFADLPRSTANICENVQISTILAVLKKQARINKALLKEK